MAQYTIKQVIKRVNFKDVINVILCALVFPFAIVAKIFIRDFWLVCEERNEARDNGYWFFKYVRENKGKQKIAYAINKRSCDYAKVRDLGMVVSYGSPSHWFWYIVADKNISSQKGGKPNAAVCYFFEVTLGLRRHNRVFLQHGVTINNGAWLYKKNCLFDKFICATKPEYEFVRDKFGYSENELALTGFARYDNLNDDATDNDLILVMPTWREWLSGIAADGTNFCDSEYFKNWNALLNDGRFNAVLKKYGKHVIFYPHRNMQKFIGEFATASDSITIADWTEYDVQDLLKRAAVLITDYSSVFFDFAYMGKPTVFYQFDEAEFRSRQYREGYFSYRDTKLGDFAENETDAINALDKILERRMLRLDDAALNEFFVYRDGGNNERIYNAIKSRG